MAREGDVLFERGMIPHAAEVLPDPADSAEVQYWQDASLPPDEQGFDGAVFINGSCTTSAVRERRRAAWAAVQVEQGTGRVLRQLCGVVPRAFQQTPQVAEFLALQFVAPWLRAGACIASDCQSVVQHFAMGAHEQISKCRPFAGIARSLHRCTDS